MSAIKNDQGKPRMDLLPSLALTQISQVLGYGLHKYGANNWRTGLPWSRVLAASMRHLVAFNNGEDIDPESGLPHLAHLGCNIMFLIEYMKTHPELDDRYKVFTNSVIVDKQAALYNAERLKQYIQNLANNCPGFNGA